MDDEKKKCHRIDIKLYLALFVWWGFERGC